MKLIFFKWLTILTSSNAVPSGKDNGKKPTNITFMFLHYSVLKALPVTTSNPIITALFMFLQYGMLHSPSALPVTTSNPILQRYLFFSITVCFIFSLASCLSILQRRLLAHWGWADGGHMVGSKWQLVAWWHISWLMFQLRLLDWRNEHLAGHNVYRWWWVWCVAN